MSEPTPTTIPDTAPVEESRAAEPSGSPGVAEQTVRGIGVSGGIAIGKAVTLRSRVGEIYRFPLPAAEVEAEVERFEEAVRRTQAELETIHRRVCDDLGQDLAGIFESHILLLKDGGFLEPVERLVRDEHVNAEWAVYHTIEKLGERFAAMENPYLQERHEDLRDVGRHLIRSLQGVSHHELSEIEGDVVVVADDLTPSDAIRLGRESICGFAIETGGRTSHTTIIARSLALPTVSCLPGVTSLVTNEDPMVVDGETGTVILHPTPETLDLYHRRQRELAVRQAGFLAERDLAARTRDGVEIALMANIDLPEELEELERYGSSGIGLYRSEFLFIEKSPDLPSEEEHLEVYRHLVEAAAPHPAVIRTYDLGGRKLAREMMATHEENPVLGLRGIRLMLARPDIFRLQLRGVLRAAVHGEVWLMIPLVSTIEEVRAFKAFVAEVAGELESEGVPYGRDIKLGIMIEVPAAALVADHLAREVDFFALGTNDLIQYSLAVDRNNEHVADLYQPLHPGILRMLRFVVDSAREAGIELSVCGEMAADPRLAALLVGLGLRRLSVAVSRLPLIKSRIREISAADLAHVAEQCLELTSAAEVEQCLDRELEGVPTS